MTIVDLKFSPEHIEGLFPCSGEEGQDVKSTVAASLLAARALDVSDVEFEWHLPDVFNVRYGSSYVATASHNGNKVRFHSTLGDFREGDDQM